VERTGIETGERFLHRKTSAVGAGFAGTDSLQPRIEIHPIEVVMASA
jgi:hypothetical protein